MKIRGWFLQQFEELFCDFRSNRDLKRHISDGTNYVTIAMHTACTNVWRDHYDQLSNELGVYGTITDVKQKIGKNQFKVVVKYRTEQDFSKFDGEYEVVESDWMSL